LNNFCGPLKTAEMYDLEKNVWTYLPDLEHPRGEIALGDLNTHLYAVGGERQIANICNLTGTNSTTPGSETIALDFVEIFDEVKRDWVIAADFPTYRFRFAAVVSNDSEIYAFGGQEAYSSTCNCFKTSNQVTIFSAKSSGYAIKLASVVGLVTGLLAWTIA